MARMVAGAGPFLYQFVGGGVLLLLGLAGALRTGALDLSRRDHRRWTIVVFVIVVVYAVVQGAFQFVLSV